MKAYIPFRGERKWMEMFIYLPEEAQVVCGVGKRTIGKLPQEAGMLYYFSAQDCQKCSRLRKCVRQNQVRMTIWVSDNYKQKIAGDEEGRREALEIRKIVERKFGKANVRLSMDGRGRLYDNIFVERFWRTIKYEEVYLHDYRTVDAVRQRLAGYIHFYKTQRLHERLGYRTPHEVYFGTSAVPMELRV